MPGGEHVGAGYRELARGCDVEIVDLASMASPPLASLAAAPREKMRPPSPEAAPTGSKKPRDWCSP